MKEARTFFIGNSREKLQRVLSLLASFMITEEDDLEIEIRPRRKEKTHQQRKLWHAMLKEFGESIGYTLPQIKQVVKQKIFGTEWVNLPDGTKLEITQSSEDEDRYGYARLIDETMRIAAEQGVLLQPRRAA
jgi:hypothetical protein